MKYIIAYIVWILNHFWIASIIFVIGLFIYYILIDKTRRRKPKLKFPILLIPSLFITSLLLLFFSHYLTIPLIYHFGEETTGTVVSIDSTASLYNEQPVYKHNVLFKDIDGDLIETSFKTSDFNVYPITNSVSYPGSGHTFILRYMKHLPHEFIIIRNENEHKLNELYKKRSELQNKLEFAPDNDRYLEALDNIETQIEAIEKEQKAARLAQFTEGNFNVSETVKDITNIESIHLNDNETMLYIEAKTNSKNSSAENIILSYDLTTHTIKSLYPISVFDDFIGVWNQSLTIQTHPDDTLIMLHTHTHKTEPMDSINTESTPFMAQYYIFETNHKNTTNQFINLSDKTQHTISYDLVNNFILKTPWHLYPPSMQSDVIHQYLSLQSIDDFLQFFNKILEDPTQVHNHNNAKSGIFFTKDRETISVTSYQQARNIILNHTHQSLFTKHLNSYAQHRILGVEQDGTVYGVASDNNTSYSLKSDPLEKIYQIETESFLEINHFESIHLDDSIIIVDQNNVYTIDKDSFTLKVSLLLQD